MQENRPEPKTENTDKGDNPATETTPETDALISESESNQKGDDQSPQG